MTGNSEKAAHYIALLDAARVKGEWRDLPELIRKINKHAPQRKVLIQTATTEHEVAISSSTASRRPTTSPASQTQSATALSTVLQADGGQDIQDSFQGKTCLLWSRWIGLDFNIGSAESDLTATAKELTDQNVTVWTRICITKSAYFRGTSYLLNGQPSEAHRVFEVALSNLQANRDVVVSTPQLAYWAEQLLAQLALASHKPAGSVIVNIAHLDIFRYWGAIATKTQEVSASRFGNSSTHVPRLAVWREYYKCLSQALQRQDQIYSTPNTVSRLQQSTELRKIERAYENELLRTVKFPTSTETNAVVEQWVEQAIQTWKLLCGPHWRDEELGEGGRNAIGRDMLEILYRAATKTFHSTLILRRLFQVHSSLSEFDLAYRAFDTYIELVDRGQVRVAKSNQPEPGHESDKAVLATISEAITSLCKFGRQAEARKAFDLSVKLEDWLTNLGLDSDTSSEEEVQTGDLNGLSAQPEIGSGLLQTVHRAIGVGKANWARWTPISESRSELQSEALESLRRACDQDTPQIETLFATSLVLAETRDIPGAIEVAKRALAKNTSSSTQISSWSTERKLIAQWHLLALLLSSRQDYESAGKSCVAAFEQFAPSQLQLGPGRNSSISSDIEKHFTATVSSFASEMESDELQRIIEVQITELALTELMDGPEEAVNSSNELLSLLSQLFAHVQIPLDTSTVTRNLVPPKSSAGTTRTTRTGIFGRNKHGSQAEPFTEKNDDNVSMTTETTRPDTRATQAPTIQITNEDEKPLSKRHHFRRSYESSRSKTTTDDASRKRGHNKNHRTQEGKFAQAPLQPPFSEKVQTAPRSALRSDLGVPDLLDSSVSPDREQSAKETGTFTFTHDPSEHNSVPVSASNNEQSPQPATNSTRPPPDTNNTSPPPRFPKTYAQKQALTMLTKVWLVIATLYRRANLFEDSKEACDEASKAAAKLEAIAGSVDQSARAFAEPGWGANSKSSDEVWADVYCERAELQLAVYKHTVHEDPSTTNEELRTAVDHYEQCLMFVPNHPSGIIGLSNVLLDSYERKVDLGRRVNDGRLQIIEHEHHNPPIIVTPENAPSTTPANGTASNQVITTDYATTTPQLSKTDEDLKKTPENLNRIAARDRAYGLLSTLTKLGVGWDNSEAWFALARAHELGGEIEKAKSVLWWCIQLEDTKPIRHWSNVGYCL